ncbi:PTS sugar transporter subunit IIB [Aerococcaceae bacterium WGS1372]
MANLRMALVDNHLLHGQIAELWCEEVQASLMIIINDKLSTNKMQQGLLDMVVPDGITCRYYSVKTATCKINEINPNKTF